MKYAEEACFVYGAGDLFKVHHVMTAATFGGEEAVLNCMCVVLVRMSMMCGCGSTSVAYLHLDEALGRCCVCSVCVRGDY